MFSMILILVHEVYSGVCMYQWQQFHVYIYFILFQLIVKGNTFLHPFFTEAYRCKREVQFIKDYLADFVRCYFQQKVVFECQVTIWCTIFQTFCIDAVFGWSGTVNEVLSSTANLQKDLHVSTYYSCTQYDFSRQQECTRLIGNWSSLMPPQFYEQKYRCLQSLHFE